MGGNSPTQWSAGGPPCAACRLASRISTPSATDPLHHRMRSLVRASPSRRSFACANLGSGQVFWLNTLPVTAAIMVRWTDADAADARNAAGTSRRGRSRQPPTCGTAV
jgi:hypothetical protein